MSVISWNNAVPAQSDTASGVDDLIRSSLTAIAVGVGQFAYWPGSASEAGASTASSGVMKLGEHRLSRAATRLGEYGDGYLSVSTIRNAVIHMCSTRTELIAHPMGYEWYRIPLTVSNGTRVGLLQMGSFTTNQNQATVLKTDFPIAYASDDSITVHLVSSNSNMLLSVLSYNASGFSSAISELGALSTSHTVTWRALGMAST